MFTLYHLIWGIISLIIIVVSLYLLNKYKPDINKVLNVVCIGSVISEIVKTLSVIRMVPSSDGSMVYPYIEMINVPLHLCSIQIVIFFYVRCVKLYLDLCILPVLLVRSLPCCYLQYSTHRIHIRHRMPSLSHTFISFSCIIVCLLFSVFIYLCARR